jgi:hypothetical protein
VLEHRGNLVGTAQVGDDTMSYLVEIGRGTRAHAPEAGSGAFIMADIAPGITAGSRRAAVRASPRCIGSRPIRHIGSHHVPPALMRRNDRQGAFTVQPGGNGGLA